MREIQKETALEIRPGGKIGERDHPQTGRMVYLAGNPVRGTEIVVNDEAEEPARTAGAGMIWTSWWLSHPLQGPARPDQAVRNHPAHDG